MNRTGRANRIIWKTVVAVALVGCGGKATTTPAVVEPTPPPPVAEAQPEPPPAPPPVVEPEPAPEPPPPPPAPAVVTVTVESHPAGAEVHVDGELVGKTPLRLERAPGTELSIKVTHKGYQEKTAALTVGDGSAQQILQVTLAKAKKRARGAGNLGTVGHGSGSGKGVGRGFILS